MERLKKIELKESVREMFSKDMEDITSGQIDNVDFEKYGIFKDKLQTNRWYLDNEDESLIIRFFFESLEEYYNQRDVFDLILYFFEQVIFHQKYLDFFQFMGLSLLTGEIQGILLDDVFIQMLCDEYSENFIGRVRDQREFHDNFNKYLIQKENILFNVYHTISHDLLSYDEYGEMFPEIIGNMLHVAYLRNLNINYMIPLSELEDDYYVYNQMIDGNPDYKDRAVEDLQYSMAFQAIEYLQIELDDGDFANVYNFLCDKNSAFEIYGLMLNETHIKINGKEYNINGVSNISSNILLKLESIERENRIGKVLYKGEAREKGKIYSDTIQKYITEVTNGNKKYDFIDGKKVLQPFTEEILQKLNYLQSLLQKSKQSGFIVFSKEDEVLKSNTDIMDIMYNFISQKGEFIFNVESSRYINTNMQTLIPETKQHFLFQVYLKNTNDFIKSIPKDIDNYDDIIKNIKASINFKTASHQRVDNNLIFIGFIRYHTELSHVWINTVQSDISKSIFGKKESHEIGFKNESLNDLYSQCVNISMKYFITFCHSKDYDDVTIPTSSTRGVLFGEHNKGFTYGYDEVPKLFGFKKYKFSDVMWKKYVTNLSPEKLNVWVLTKLNEKLKKLNIDLTLNEIMDFIINDKAIEKRISRFDEIRISNLKKYLLS